MAGIIQIAIGIALAGELSSFFPSCVIKSLVSAIGVLSSIDSRVPAELALDLGNVIGTRSLGSMDYGVSVAGVKLISVLGHNRCGPVRSLIQRFNTSKPEPTGISTHLTTIVNEVPHALNSDEQSSIDSPNDSHLVALIDDVAKRNVMRAVDEIKNRRESIREQVDSGQILIVRAMHDVRPERSIPSNEAMANLAPSPRSCSGFLPIPRPWTVALLMLVGAALTAPVSSPPSITRGPFEIAARGLRSSPIPQIVPRMMQETDLDARHTQ